ncbi:hypothetical protein [Treponema sp. R6D11]
MDSLKAYNFLTEVVRFLFGKPKKKGRKIMKFRMKLPRNGKEFLLFMAIISVISVNVIAPLITCFELQNFSLAVWVDVLKVMPVLWVAVVILVLATYRPSEWLTYKIINKNDSFNAHILCNIVCSVFFLSILLTVIGTWIGSRHISLEPITHFFYKWFRNFGISFGVELLLAQPVARFVMHKYHEHLDNKGHLVADK